MKSFYFKYIFTTFISTLFFIGIEAQDNQNLWLTISKQNATQGKLVANKSEMIKGAYYQLDIVQLKSILSNAPQSSNDNNITDVIIPFPNSEGSFNNFRVKEASILESSFQLKHPELRSYIGQNIKNASEIIRFSITPKGLNTIQLSSTSGTQFIEPLTQNGNSYMVYSNQSIPDEVNNLVCYFDESNIFSKKTNINAKVTNATDGKLRTFKIALASTIEYSSFHWMAAGLTAGNTEAEKRAKVLEAMVVTMTRVNGIYERDLAIKLQMIDNTNIIFINSDSFTNNNAQTLSGESQTVIDGAIGAANYDIGHTFATGGGGFASPGVCVNGVKARGSTGSPTPVGDGFDIGFVAHEIGHQFGAPHTFNGDVGNCAGNRYDTNAYEPGSGSTIMSYAGICAPQNIQNQSDAYFHQKSLQMIWDFITTGNGTCAVLSNLSNTAPTAIAGSNYTIPISTPFKLVGNSTDADGTASHTYTWEQYDLGPAGLPNETNVLGPLVRSFEGTNNPVRNIPRLSDYLVTNGSTTWEKLSSVNRTLNFALTVRDNAINGGQTDVDFMEITVNSIDPFKVTNPVSWAPSSNQTVEWIVGQTDNISTINCQTVNIKLSIDGGLTYPINLALGTPNDGSETIMIPAIADTATARILVEAADNIFYDISDFNFSISSNPDFFIVNAKFEPFGCGSTIATCQFDYVAVNGFSENTTFSATGNPAGSTVIFSPTNLNTSGSVTMTVSNINPNNSGNYPVIIKGTSSPSGIIKNSTINLAVFSNLCTSKGNGSDQTGTTLVQFNTINNQSLVKPTAAGGYSNYTSLSTVVNRNSTYNLTINANTAGNYTTSTKVWIDWNQNCSLNDVGEEYLLGNTTNKTNGPTANSGLPITIPADAVLGNIIMRVSTKYNATTLTPCESGYYGEVEDYTLIVSPTLGVEKLDFVNFAVFPNPNKGSFTVKLKGSLEPSINISIFDISGRHIYDKNFTNNQNFQEEIDLNNVKSGLYLLNVNDGRNKSTKKIIIE